MKRIVSGLWITVDGVIEAADKWSFDYYSDEVNQSIGGLMAGGDTFLLGATTYREFASFWPAKGTDDPIAVFMNNTPKFVVSTTLDTVEWSNSTLVSGDVAEQVAKLKEQPGKDILVTGSATLVRWLLHQRLLDELHLYVCPIVLGSGKRLFEPGSERLPLQLTESERFPKGIVRLSYQPA